MYLFQQSQVLNPQKNASLRPQQSHTRQKIMHCNEFMKIVFKTRAKSYAYSHLSGINLHRKAATCFHVYGHNMLFSITLFWRRFPAPFIDAGICVFVRGNNLATVACPQPRRHISFQSRDSNAKHFVLIVFASSGSYPTTHSFKVWKIILDRTGTA